MADQNRKPSFAPHQVETVTNLAEALQGQHGTFAVLSGGGCPIMITPELFEAGRSWQVIKVSQENICNVMGNLGGEIAGGASR